MSIEATALALLDTPRVRAGNHPDSGFDCSGFTQYVFHVNGIFLPRTVAGQWTSGTQVGTSPQSGDLVFFDIKLTGRTPTHVGLALNWPQFIHVSSKKMQLSFAEARPPYWTPRYVGAVRVAE